MKYKVALTGGIGSGKTTVSQQFEALGVSVVDADIIAREVVLPKSKGLVQLVTLLGDSILNPDGTLDRAYLRHMMFNENENALLIKNKVNAILHPLIKETTQRYFNEATSDYVLWVVPLLFENKLNHEAQRVLVIDVPESIQIKRTINRDCVSEAQVKKIIEAQIPRVKRINMADDILNGHLPLDEMKEQVKLLHHHYIQLAKKFKKSSR
ncbi:dephospho-CoA kinase [Thorsellia kenyensis]|uniref:Dephospho-CoA kinase n=1 Tax=Thorsellia kenyensis TaxID=1549888 RepID=A0ABV6CH71_9GAMM